MNLNDFSYCYLNNIYRTGDVVAFELALADRLFKRCAISLVNSEQLIEIANMDNLIKDFKIVDGLLKCTTVKIVPAIPGIESEIGKLTEIKQDEGSFYALIREGSDKDYVMIDEKLMDVTGNEDNLVGAGLAKFTDIRHSSSFTGVWNKLYPSENVSSSKALAQVKSHVSNLNTAVKKISGESLTSAQTKTIYETSNDYDDSPYNQQRGWGSVYCVVNKKIKYADGNNHTLVSCYDLVGGGYLVSACMMGKYVYAKMLKVSGVGIDPTNPKTYLNDLAKSDTYVPGGTSNGNSSGSSSTNAKVNTWLSQQGVEVSTLAPKQISLMEGIYGLLGTPYKSCRHSKGCDGYCYDSNNPSHLDAATFIWRSFRDADMRINSLTCNALLSDGHFSRVAWKDRKPGDVLVTFGEKKPHAMFYLKDKGNTLTVVEAIAGKESKVTDLARGTSIYSSKNGSKNLVHYGSKGGKKYVLLRYNGIAN